MFPPILRVLPLLLLFPVLAPAAEDTEPPLAYTLRINGKEIRMEPGAEVQIDGEFKDPKVTLVPDRTRKFTYAGVSFSYPSNFAFETNPSGENPRLWTLDGNDVVIMLQAFEGVKTSAPEFANALKKNYGPQTKIEPVKHTFNGKEYSGVRVRATIAKTKVVQDVLVLPTEDGSRLLLLQGVAPEDEAPGEEAELVLKLLNESLKL